MNRVAGHRIAGALAAAVAFSFAGVAHASFPGANGKIAFQSPTTTGAGTFSVYTMNPDGTGKSQLTMETRGAAVGSRSPAYSADGTKIAYAKNTSVSPNLDIVVANANGSAPVNVTQSPTVNETSPALSPDGAKIAYVGRPDASADSDIYLANIDGTGTPVNLTAASTDSASTPEFSPDGTTIAYDDATDVLTIPVTGGLPTNLTPAGGAPSATHPTYSPDGTTLAFESFDGTERDIVTLPPSGGAPTELTTQSASDAAFHPAYSPDGTRIAFMEGPISNRDISTMSSVDGSDRVNLTSELSMSDQVLPAWQPIVATTPDPPGPDPNPDTAKPNTEIKSGPARKTKSKSAKFTFSSNEAGAKFECALSGRKVKEALARFQPCNSPQSYEKLKPGGKKFEVRAIDKAGNVDGTPATHSWTIKKKKKGNRGKKG